MALDRRTFGKRAALAALGTLALAGCVEQEDGEDDEEEAEFDRLANPPQNP